MSLPVLLDVAIGLFFAFAITAGLASVLTEVISRVLGLRAAYLLGGLRELVGKSSDPLALGGVKDAYTKFREAVTTETGPDVIIAENAKRAEPIPRFTDALLGSPLIRGTGMQGTLEQRPITMKPSDEKVDQSARKGVPGSPPPPKFDVDGRGTSPWDKIVKNRLGRWRLLRSCPPYIPARTFALATVSLLTPDPGQPLPLTPEESKQPLRDLRNTLPKIDDEDLRQSLEVLVDNADGEIAAFRRSLEAWYDDHMARVSGWYKRRVAIFTVVIGATLVLLFNVNAVTIARALYVDADTRAAVVAVATNATDCSPATTTAPSASPEGQQASEAPGGGNTPGECLKQVKEQVAKAQEAGLPIGWTPENRSVWSGWAWAFHVLGLMVTVIALTPGSRFWFDFIGKLGSLRSTGPPPETK